MKLSKFARRLFAVFCLLALCQAPAAWAGQKFQYAVNSQSGPSVSAHDLGLKAIKRKAALVYYSADDKSLAEGAANLQEKMYRRVQKIVGIPIKVHGLILVSNTQELPAGLRHAYWVNVDGVSCLLRVAKGPLVSQGDEFFKLAFFMLAHESVDMGIKAALLGGRLTQSSASSRWWVEGIADYAATQAALKDNKRALSMTKRLYIEALEKFKEPNIDLESGKTWWPTRNATPENVQYAYTAANYAIATLCAKHGGKWIAETLDRIKREGKGDRNTSADFCRIARAVTGENVSTLIHDISVKKVKKFVESL